MSPTARAAGASPALLKLSGKIEPMLVSSLRQNPWQPRTQIDPGSLEDLKKSIQDFGFIGYVPVRKADPADPESPLQIIYGHRRVRAARMLGLQTVPVMLCELEDEGMMRLAYVENSTHRSMTYWDEAKHFGEMKLQLNLSIRQLAEMLGVSRNYVFNRLSLLSLPEDSPLRIAAERNDISITAAQIFSNLAKALTGPELETLIADVRAGTISKDDLQGLQRALDRAYEMDGDIGEDGERIRTATLIDQARNRRLRPTVIDAPEVSGETTRVEREDAATRRRAVDRLLESEDAGIGAAPTLDDAASRPRSGDHPATPVGLAAVAVAADPTASGPAPATGPDRATIPARDGAFYAREALGQLEGILTHLGPRLEKADFSLVTPEERVRFDRLRQELIAALRPF
jgi:ParB/RepB/Spo0J family partition protein